MSRARVLADYVAGGTTAAEFDHMDGVTSNVQTQLDAKAPKAGPTFTGTVAIPNVANLETAVVANTAKVTNATHTGDVTGSTALTIANDAVGTDELANDVVINTSGAITTTSSVGIGRTADDTVQHEAAISGSSGGTRTPILQVAGTSDTTTSIRLARYSADVEPANLHFVKGRGGVGSSTIAANGDSVGAVTFSVEDGNAAPAMGAGISSTLVATPSNGTAEMDMRFFTADGSAPEERMRIDKSGNVGIGKSSSILTGLHVYHASTNNIITVESGDIGAGIQFKDTSQSEPVSMYSYGNEIRFSVSGADKMSILSGGGITFNGDTATANALDDYEEGTFTPTILAGGSSLGSLGTQSGGYTKIGDRVFISIHIATLSKNSQEGTVQIGGLPFAVASQANMGYTALTPWAYQGLTSTGSIILRTEEGFSKLVIQSCTDAGVGSTLDESQIATHINFMVGGNYIAG